MKPARALAESCISRSNPDWADHVDAIEAAIVADRKEQLSNSLRVVDEAMDEVKVLRAANDAWAAKCGALREQVDLCLSEAKRGDEETKALRATVAEFVELQGRWIADSAALLDENVALRSRHSRVGPWFSR